MKPPYRAAAAIAFAMLAGLGAGTASAATVDMTATNTGFFKSVDINGDGKVSRVEIIQFSGLVFVSTDAEDDG